MTCDLCLPSNQRNSSLKKKKSQEDIFKKNQHIIQPIISVCVFFMINTPWPKVLEGLGQNDL